MLFMWAILICDKYNVGIRFYCSTLHSLLWVITHQFYTVVLKDYTPGATNLTFPLGSVEGQSLCSNFAIMNDLIAENTETFKVVLNTSDPDVTIGDCDGSGVPSLKIYINESDGKNVEGEGKLSLLAAKNK